MWILLTLTACDSTDRPTDTRVTDTASDTDTPEETGIEPSTPQPPPLGTWVRIETGSFLMGNESPAPDPDEAPQHTVTLASFWIQQTEGQSEHYAACLADGLCPPVPTEPTRCHTEPRPGLPQNCLTWDAAALFCHWMGGRLPSEAEWEFAASSRGAETVYPWGEEEPDCTRANVFSDGVASCNDEGMWESCTHPAGNTPLGLCEMGGNAFEWTADWYAESYDDHPTDGTAQEVPFTQFRTLRGGGIGSEEPLRIRSRTFHAPDFFYSGMGVRCVAD